MHEPIIAPAVPLVDTLPMTADIGMCCAGCLETLAPDGACLNIGACADADKRASYASRGDAMSARRASAWTISGGVD